MAVQQANLQQLSNSLLQTLSPDVNIRKPAERLVESLELQAGFCQTLLCLVEHQETDRTVKLCSAIAFKNFVKKYWAKRDDSEPDRINQIDRDYCKTVIVNLMLTSDEQVQKQLSEAVSIIGRHDFPAKWPQLLESMISKLEESRSVCNFNVINGVLQTANSLFERYQYEAKSQELWQEIKFVLDSFAKPFTLLFDWIIQLIPNHMNNVQNLKILFNSLLHCAKIFFSLNSQDLAEFFEDNIKCWMDHFVQLIHDTPKILESDNPDEPGILEDLKTQICEIIGMFADKYNEEFEPYLPGFIQQVWTLLGSLDSSPKYDLLVSHAIRFLSIIAERGLHKEIFEREQVLQEISSRIIIPNMEFRESDEELFEDNPEEYIRRDIEGADIQTRRRAACDFVKALSKHFEKPMNEVFTKYIQTMLNNYNQNQQQNWKSKNAAIYLITSLVVKGGSVRLGTTSTSDLIDISSFFNDFIKCDLDRVDINELPVLKADALKYIIIFRNQLSLLDTILPVLPQIIRHLSSPSIVIHSYAANCIEKLLTLRDPCNKSLPLVKCEQISQHGLLMLEGLFGVLQKQGSFENEYAIKAILRVFSLLRERLVPYFNVLLPKLTEKLVEVSKNPSRPNFNHYLFETVSLSIKIGCSRDSSAVSNFELMLFPIFNDILVKDISEFMPYFFQILALMCEMHQPPQPIPAPYRELFPFLLAPVLWERPANFSPLVRLIQAYIGNSAKEIISDGKLEPLLGVFQKLISNKSYDHLGFGIINNLILHADPTALSAMMKQIYILLFQRLTSSKTGKFVRSLLVFFSLFIYKYGSRAFYDIIESIQSNMFNMVLEKLFILDAQKVSGPIDKKTICVGITKLLVELDHFLTSESARLWAPLLQVLIAVFELPEDTSTDGEEHFVEIEQVAGYQASYSKLLFATPKETDPIPDIANPRLFLVQGLSKLSTQHPGKLTPLISSMQPDAVNFLQNYLLQANVNLS